MSTLTTPKPPAQPGIFNLPNQLTGLRFVLSIVLFALISLEQWAWCVAVFSVAAITDWLDGYLARRLNLGSTLGRNLDPLVDKILICGAFTFLLSIGAERTGISAWMVVVVVSRELLVTSLRSFIENRGARFGADWGGKIKMALQCAALILIFLNEAARGLETVAWTWVLRDVLIYAMIVSTVVSGLQYLIKAASLLRTDEQS